MFCFGCKQNAALIVCQKRFCLESNRRGNVLKVLALRLVDLSRIIVLENGSNSFPALRSARKRERVDKKLENSHLLLCKAFKRFLHLLQLMSIEVCPSWRPGPT